MAKLKMIWRLLWSSYYVVAIKVSPDEWRLDARVRTEDSEIFSQLGAKGQPNRNFYTLHNN